MNNNKQYPVVDHHATILIEVMVWAPSAAPHACNKATVLQDNICIVKQQ